MSNLFALLLLVSIIFLIIGFFNPDASLFWYRQEKTRTKSSLIYGIAIVVSFVLFGVTMDTKEKSRQDTKEESRQDTKEESRQGKWTEVYAFEGNGMKKSPVFELTGGDARLRYKYDGGEMGIGMFAVYVVDEGSDIMETGGFPEVMTTEESEESESSLQKGEGRYYLDVDATGSWTVIVEEYK